MNKSLTVAICAIVLLSAVLIPSTYADWQMYRSDPAHTGSETGSPVLTPTLLWNDSITAMVEPNSIMGMSTPAIAGGVVYVGELTWIPDEFFFDKLNSVFAFNATNGELNWKCYGSGDSGIGTPTVTNGTVFFSALDYVAAMRTNSPAILWEYSMFATSPPDVVNGVVTSVDISIVPSISTRCAP